MAVRLRLTMLYAVLFLLSGAVLLAVTYLLVAHSGTSFVWSTEHQSPDGVETVTNHLGFGRPESLDAAMRELAAGQQAVIMRELLVKSCLALAVMVVLSAGLGWLVAGRVLRPLHVMNSRLEAALDSHKRFVANAAHELRTPLTLEHALLEETVLDPDATADTYRAQFAELMAVSEQKARLLESLLVLATSERGLDRREPVDLAALTGDLLRVRDGVLRGLLCDSRAADPAVWAELRPAVVTGDPVLVERLVANLIDNAFSYNVPGGRVDVATDGELLTVVNTGPVVPPDLVEHLLSPFQRLDRTADDDGHHGLGLSIVHAIAVAHSAELNVCARQSGGLAVRVRFVPGV